MKKLSAPKLPAAPLPAKRKLPATAPPTKQYDLFTQFFGKAEDLSNTIELWDAIPKFSVTARRQVDMRDGNDRLPVHEHRFEFNNRLCRLEVQPASIKVDGDFRDFYPSADEELVEEVIRKIFADQRYGMHFPGELGSWVRFSLQMIRKELAARGKTRSLAEIKRSIDILSSTIVRLFVTEDSGAEKQIYNRQILSEMIPVKGGDLAGDTSATWAAQLPALISQSVNELTYRQFDYGTFMRLSGQLARWFHKRLSHNFVQASLFDHFTIKFSTIRRDSGLLEHDRVNVNTKAVESALDDLKSQKVLMSWSKQETRGQRNKVVDVKYTLNASLEFIDKVKAANARQRDARGLPKAAPRQFPAR